MSKSERGSKPEVRDFGIRHSDFFRISSFVILFVIMDKCPRVSYFSAMVETATPELQPGIIQEEKDESKSELEPGYLVICWNDPVNLMGYVTHVFLTVFGCARQQAEFHMLQVHEQGKSVLARESMEKAEHYVHQLQKYSLHATLERDE